MLKPTPIFVAVSLAIICSMAVLSGCKMPSHGVVAEPKAAKAASTSRAGLNGIAFEEVAKRSGLHYRWKVQPRPMRNLEAFGSGCAFLDYDNDGWQDILLVDKPSAVLFRNRRNGTFENVTTATRLTAQQGDWKGCAVGDYDGDGFVDLLLTGFRSLALLRNQRGHGWQNVTQQAGLDPQDRGHWGSSAGFMDLDGNGTLDFVLGHYVVFGPKEKQYCYLSNGIKSGCPPHVYRPEFAELWQNLGNGRFKEVTASSGMKKTHGKALVFAFADVNNDNKIDFYIGNDGTLSELMLNQGNLRFRNIGQESGIAYGVGSSTAMAAMGADWADYNGDGKLDLAISGFSNESCSLQRNNGQGLFEQVSTVTGLAAATLKPLGFGTKWLDMDNDSWPDLMFVNGHVYDKSADMRSQSVPFRQTVMLFHNRVGYLDQRVFEDIAPRLGGGLTKPILGRGSATGDYDNDGRMDALAVDYEGEPLLLHNTSHTSNHWIKLDLRSKGPNRFAYGAKVIARKGRRVWVEHVSPTSSYLSSSDPRIHLGLGQATSLDEIAIFWPNGKREVLRHVGADRILTIKQGSATAATQPPKQ